MNLKIKVSVIGPLGKELEDTTVVIDTDDVRRIRRLRNVGVARWVKSALDMDLETLRAEE